MAFPAGKQAPPFGKKKSAGKKSMKRKGQQTPASKALRPGRSMAGGGR